jgi:hypothetical protein
MWRDGNGEQRALLPQTRASAFAIAAIIASVHSISITITSRSR